MLFFFNDTATTEIYTLSLHERSSDLVPDHGGYDLRSPGPVCAIQGDHERVARLGAIRDRKSTRLNSSHSQISYAVFCLKKKKKSMLRSPRDWAWYWCMRNCKT